MAATPTDIVNQAIQLIGDNQPLVTGNFPAFDQSAAGKAAQQLYLPCVQTVARQFEWDMARNTFTLQLSGNFPAYWLYEYIYPPVAVEIWQLVPAPAALTDPNNPLPTTWQVANALVGASPIQTKVIQTNLANAVALINNAPGPAIWDPLFREEVVRLLASEIAMAVAGKPDTAAAMLETAAQFGQIGMKRDS